MHQENLQQHGPILFGRSGGQTPDPTPPTEVRSSSFSPLRRAISVLTGRSRDPQPPPPRRGRSPTRERSSSRGESGGYTDTSSYQTDVQRSDENREGHPPSRIVVTQPLRGRTTVSPPPQFYEAVYLAGVRAGAGIHPSQSIQMLSDGDDTDQASTPREVNQPQGEPEPEMPGGTEPSESDQTSRTNEGENR